MLLVRKVYPESERLLRCALSWYLLQIDPNVRTRCKLRLVSASASTRR